MKRKHVSTCRHLSLEALEDRLCLSSLPIGTPTAPTDAATQARLGAAYGRLPLSFEANRGQTDSRVNFLSRGAGYSLFLTPSKAVLSLKHGDTSNVVGMSLVGSDSGSRAVGVNKLASMSNYLIGNDRSKWHTNVPNYGKVSYKSVYRGIDLVYHGNQKQLEYDFTVRPGADPRAIRLSFDGSHGKTIDAQGDLVLHTTGGDLVEHAPVAYQMIHGVRHSIAAHFLLGRDGRVRFQVGHYDHSKPLVIDPVLSYSTYLGGGNRDTGYGIAVDSAGNAYITGHTTSTNFPTKTPLQPHVGGPKAYTDAFVTKLNPTGSALVYSTYLGGKWNDNPEGIAVDSAGNAFVTGWTSSPNFPTKNAYQTSTGGGPDAFVAKLNAAGSALLYSTYLGGSDFDQSHAIAVDGSGKVYVTGETSSLNFPTANALQSARGGGSDAFVAKFDTSLVGAPSLVYSTFLGGSTNPYRGFEIGAGIAADSLGNAYVTGQTDSADFPTTLGAFQTANGGGADTFVTKINAAGSALVYSTFLGGANSDRGYGIALDASGNAYVTGQTGSTNYPTLNALQSAPRGSIDAFVTKLSADGSALVYSTYLGGSGIENGLMGLFYPHLGGIAVDAFGYAFVTGVTYSTDFPTVSAFQTTYGGGVDAFVAELTPSGTSFVYSSYLGGNSEELALGIAVDGAGNAYVTGSTASLGFPTKSPLQSIYGGGESDVFVTKISGT